MAPVRSRPEQMRADRAALWRGPVSPARRPAPPRSRPVAAEGALRRRPTAIANAPSLPPKEPA